MNVNSPRLGKDALIFVHIPKTAGSTFSSILLRMYRAHTYSIYGTAQIKRFRQMPEAERAKIDLLQGHFSYGIHEYIPRYSRYITFLRNPVERTLSMYYYILGEPEHGLHNTLVSNKISLAEFVNSSYALEVYNFQVRMIAGIDQLDSDVSPTLDDAALSLAKQRLTYDFWTFGITEKFDESLVLLSYSLGWKLLVAGLFYPKKNVSHKRKTLTSVPPEIIATICQNNQLDLDLYHYACKLFDTRVKYNTYFRAQLFTIRRFHQFGLMLNGIRRRYRSVNH